MKIKAADARPGFAGYQFGVNDDENEVKSEQTTLEDLPQTDDDGKAKFTVTLDKMPDTSRPLEAQITVRLVESGGRAVERNLTLPIVPTADDDRRQAAVLRQVARRGRERRLRRDRGRARRQAACGIRPALRTAQDRAALSILPPRRPLGVRAGQEHAAHGRRPHRRRRRQARPHLAARDLGPLSPRCRERRPQHSADLGDVRRRASTRMPPPTRRISWKSRSTRPNTRRATR